MSREQIPVVNAPLATSDTGSTANTYVKRDSNADISTRRFLTPVGGGIRNLGDWTRAYAAKTANYTVADGDDIIYADAAGGSFTVTLPAAASSAGLVVTVVKTTSANTVTIQGAAAELINAANTLAMTTQYTTKTLHCNGTQWYVVAS